jgi:altronate hydrolase
MRVHKIHRLDNVAVAIDQIPSGSEVTIDGKIIIIHTEIPAGHKFALAEISTGDSVIKYGYPIGHATNTIKPGDHVHSHNVKTNLQGNLEYSYNPRFALQTKRDPLTFMGYRRANGKVGVRNEIWIIPTAGCVNKPAEKIVTLAQSKFEGKTDGIFAFVHPYGCSQMGDDHIATQKILADLVKHPNAAGVLVLGLGCENNQIDQFKKVLGDYDADRVLFLEAQSSPDEIEEGVSLIGKLVDIASKDRRTECSTKDLIIGHKCGGSDGLSGITANPLLGDFSDRIIAYGGSSILTEVPEMFGAETILMERSANKDIFDQTVSLINNFKDYFVRHNQVVYDNPSPGNKAGGITTLEDKSLGCVQKGGTSIVTEVLTYGSVASKPGLILLEGPGNDMIAVTALAAAGAQIILFSTGRGTPLGGPVPAIKVSSNTDLATRKKNWIDFDAGRLLEEDPEKVKEEFVSYVLAVASGKQTCNEKNNYRDISIFKDGVIL